MTNFGQLFPTNSFIIPVITKGASEISSSFNRPDDTTVYVANNSLSNSTNDPTPLVFENVARIDGGSGYLVNAICCTNQLLFLGALRLHLFKGSSPAAINDNSPYPVLLANNSKRIGYIDFTTFATGGIGSDVAISFGGFPQSRLIPFTCNPSDSSLFGLVEVRTGFTPVSQQSFAFHLGVEQN